ncbi:DotA/TraY family protein, partial [Mesorhizobium sp.]|uniref:DotA/TraY family protein n=1 Tax=Mesorhizobium sp. TaxID=1871066 RepID=UPI000FE7C39F
MPGPIDLLSTPSQHDIAWSWVTAILPADMSSPYGAAVGTFASALGFLASLFLGYHIIVGIVSSAHSGKVLGDKFHQTWAPLRVVIGFGMLIPIAGGFSAAHYMLRDLVALPGINLGNAAWLTFVDKVATDDTPIVARPAGGSRLVLDIMEHEICAAVTNAAGNTWGFYQALPPANGEEVGAGLFFGSNDRVQWDYGQDCGRLSFGLISDRPNFSATRREAVGGIVSAVRTQAGTYAALFKRVDTTLSPDQAMSGVADGTLPVGLARNIREMGTAYDATIAQAAKRDVADVATESRSRLVDAARQDGWVNSGAYWYGLAQISGLTNALTGEQAEQVAVRYGEGNTGFERNVRAAIETLRYHIAGEEARVG